MDDKLKKPDVFGGFQALTGSLLGDFPGEKTDDNIEEVDNLDDILKETQDTDDELDDDNEPIKKKKRVPEDEVPSDEETEDEEEVVETGTTDEPNELTEFEPDITKFLQEKLGEELGVEFGEDEKFNSVKELVDYFKGVVEESSKPNYATEEIEKLNEFVLNGGKLEDYYKNAQPGGLNVDTLDATKDTDAKLAVREKLRLQGYNEDRIKRSISRYEDSGTLNDEGEDAVEFLKEYKEAAKERLLTETQKNAEDAKKQQQKFVSTVQENIKSLDAIRGIKISSKDKQDLVDYIFKPDSEGLTKYQRDYMSDVKNLIESAYFTKKGDQLISAAKKTATSDAYKDLHQKLKASKGKRHAGGGDHGTSGSSDSLTSLLGKHLLK